MSQCDHFWGTMEEEYGWVSVCEKCGKRESAEHSQTCFDGMFNDYLPCTCGAAEEFARYELGAGERLGGRMTLEELLGHIKDGNWDWPENEYSWLSSQSGITRQEADGAYTSIFFIRGGRIRHQAQIPYGYHSVEDFIVKLRERAEGLDNPTVNWVEDSGGGDNSFWIEGTRLPNEADIARLEAAKEYQRLNDDRTLAEIKRRRGSL